MLFNSFGPQTVLDPNTQWQASDPQLPSLSGGPEVHRQIAARDPLNAASAMASVPELNRRRDVPGLLRLLREILPEHLMLEPPAGWTFAECAAAMRDVGLILGSVRRHGVEPLPEIPRLTGWLLKVGAWTALPPRDTLLHYTLWNPDHALRTYTDLREEVELIRAVKLAFPALEDAIQELLPLFDLSPEAPEFGLRCSRIRAALKGFRDAAVHTYREVDRGVFIRDIRPYFEPIDVLGRSYLGPGAVAMPLFVFDHILWSASVDVPSYTQFKEDYLPVTLPYLRQLYERHSAVGCLVDRLIPSLARLGDVEPVVRRNMDELFQIFELTHRFRSVHLRMAEQAYVEGDGPFEKGSGGYSPDMLVRIFELSRQAQERLRPFLSRSAPVLAES